MRRKMASLLWLLALAACGAADDGTGTPDAAPTGVTAKFSSLYGTYLVNCKGCHAPDAPGMSSSTEKTLDFSSQAMAYTTIKTGMASGLTGNQTGCNGVPFLAATPGASLLVAVLDKPTRDAFDLTSHPDCDMDAITDETAKLPLVPLPTGYVAALKEWVTAGAPNN